jgi:hypothetical protein
MSLGEGHQHFMDTIHTRVIVQKHMLYNEIQLSQIIIHPMHMETCFHFDITFISISLPYSNGRSGTGVLDNLISKGQPGWPTIP